MKFNPIANGWIANTSDVEQAAFRICSSLASLRKLHNLPLAPYDKNVHLEEIDHIFIGIVRGAMLLGIDFGIKDDIYYNLIDLTKFND